MIAVVNSNLMTDGRGTELEDFRGPSVTFLVGPGSWPVVEEVAASRYVPAHCKVHIGGTAWALACTRERFLAAVIQGLQGNRSKVLPAATLPPGFPGGGR